MQRKRKKKKKGLNRPSSSQTKHKEGENAEGRAEVGV
jgi:hypothetical protein